MVALIPAPGSRSGGGEHALVHHWCSRPWFCCVEHGLGLAAGEEAVPSQLGEVSQSVTGDETPWVAISCLTSWAVLVVGVV